jgi:hypothetical protein
MFRKSCGFEPLSIHKPADFTGEWLISNCESIIPSGGFGSAPYKLSIHQLGNELSMKSYTESEYSNDEIIDQILTLDGKDVKSVVFSGAPRIQNANWSEFRDKLTIDSNITFKFGNRESKISSKDVWHLSSRGNKLIINRTVNSFRGKQESTLVYNRQR